MPIKKKHLWQNRRFTILVARNFALIAGAFAVLLGLALLLSRGVTLRNIRSQQGDMDRANLRRQIQQAELQVRSVRLTMIQLAEESDIRVYFQQDQPYTTDYERMAVRNRVLSNLRYKSVLNNALRKMYIYNAVEQEILSPDYGVCPSSQYVDTIWQYFYDAIQQKGRADPLVRADPETGASIISLANQMPLLLKGNYGVLVSNLSSRALFDEALEDAAYYVTDAQGQMIASYENLPLFSSLPAFIPQEARQQKGVYLIQEQGESALLAVDQSPTYGWWFYSLDHLAAFNARTAEFNRAMRIIAAIGLLMALIFAYALSVRMFLPVKKILYILEERSNEMILPMEHRSESGNEIKFLADTMLHTLNRNKELTNTLAQRLERLNQVRLRLLRSQINPHFLYNTLASINWMALEKLPDDNEISDALCTLSEMLRTSLKSPTFVPLDQEMEQLERYIMLQKLCFRNEIALHVRLQPEAADGCVPSMLLQPLLENAVKHGMNRESGQLLQIQVTGEKKGEQMHLLICNNGLGLTPEQLAAMDRDMREESPGRTGGIGLNNVYQQLTLLFEQDASIVLDSPHGAGFQVEIWIPYIQKSDLPEA